MCEEIADSIIFYYNIMDSQNYKVY
ncbi:rCG32988 [Rattus norvegicus]|uniref:RCG32988 n=1 Tax=Rattus norvegicus TaxID=10116 RepID=A6HDI4_RAT|nr:rCG32988 [Rattus norvegicus]